MPRPTPVHLSDLHGSARLAADATAAVTDIVEAMHEAAVRLPVIARSPTGRVGGIAGLAYSSVRGVARLVGGALDVALTPLVPLLSANDSTPERDAVLSALNGVVGDHLAATGNPLAVKMELRRRGLPLRLERSALATALPDATARIAVFLHGLCGTDAQWRRRECDYGLQLERDFGFTRVYLRYNSGRHISTNGRDLDRLLELLVDQWPGAVDELLLIGHSMGGLVARSAAASGSSSGQRWTSKLRRMAFLGSPHHGAPLERGGHWFEEVLGSIPYAAPLSRLGRLRSAGITDLRHGNVHDEDWMRSGRFEHAVDKRRVVPLPRNVDCIAVAATTGARRGDARDRLVGDGLVPVASALGHHRDASRHLGVEDRHCLVVPRTNHMGLLGHGQVYEFLEKWIEAGGPRD